MFLSIFLATCRPKNLIGFLDNLAATANDLSSFEVLLKLDDDALELADIIDNYAAKAKFRIKYLGTEKLRGYYSLHKGYDALLKIADPDTYFCWLLTDEIRFETKGWDDILKKYVGIYPDDIFRVKLSMFQLKNYYDFSECLPCPDNYALTTMKWLKLTGGWGDFWGPDSWHQCIDYYLGLSKNPQHPFGIWRSISVYDVKIGGQEAGLGIGDNRKMLERTINILYGWHKFSTHAAQENYYRLAHHLNAHIYAAENNIKDYFVLESPKTKMVSLHSRHNEIVHLVLSYRLPRLKFKLFVGRKTASLINFVPQPVFYLLYPIRTPLAKLYKLIRPNIKPTRIHVYAFNSFVLVILITVVKMLLSSAQQILSLPGKLVHCGLSAINRVIQVPKPLYKLSNILFMPVYGLEFFTKICNKLIKIIINYRELDPIVNYRNTKLYLYENNELKEFAIATAKDISSQ